MKVGVITGGHTFDVIGFHHLFRSLEGLDCYIQSLEEWAADANKYGPRYDVLVFYNMHTELPENCPGGKRTRQAIDGLGDGTGILVFHHGILAFNAFCCRHGRWTALLGDRRTPYALPVDLGI